MTAIRHLRLVPPIANTVDLTIFERPDVLDLADLRVILGPEPDGTVGADLELIHDASFVRMTPIEARQLAAAIVRAANDVEALVATG